MPVSRRARSAAAPTATMPFTRGASDAAAVAAYRRYAGGAPAQSIAAPAGGGILPSAASAGGGAAMSIGAPAGGMPFGGMGGGPGATASIPIPNYGPGGLGGGPGSFPGGAGSSQGATGGSIIPWMPGEGFPTSPRQGDPRGSMIPWKPHEGLPGTPGQPGVGGSTAGGNGSVIPWMPGEGFPGSPRKPVEGGTGPVPGEQSPGIPWQDPNRPNPFMQPGRPWPGQPGYDEWLRAQYPNEDLSKMIGSFPNPGAGQPMSPGAPSRGFYTSPSGRPNEGPAPFHMYGYTNPDQPPPGMPGRRIIEPLNVREDGSLYPISAQRYSQMVSAKEAERDELVRRLQPSPGDLNPYGMSMQRTKVLQENGTWPTIGGQQPASSGPPAGNSGSLPQGVGAQSMGMFSRPYQSSGRITPGMVRSSQDQLVDAFPGAAGQPIANGYNPLEVEGNMGGPNGQAIAAGGARGNESPPVFRAPQQSTPQQSTVGAAQPSSGMRASSVVRGQGNESPPVFRAPQQGTAGTAQPGSFQQRYEAWRSQRPVISSDDFNRMREGDPDATARWNALKQWEAQRPPELRTGAATGNENVQRADNGFMGVSRPGGTGVGAGEPNAGVGQIRNGTPDVTTTPWGPMYSWPFPVNSGHNPYSNWSQQLAQFVQYMRNQQGGNALGGGNTGGDSGSSDARLGLLGALARNAQDQLNSYNASTNQRDDLIRRLYGQRSDNTFGWQGASGANLSNEYKNREDRAMEMANNIGASDLDAVRDAYTQQRARANQGLASRGLGNTTIRDSVQTGITRDESKAYGEALDRIGRMRLQTYAGMSGDRLANDRYLHGERVGLLRDMPKDLIDYLERIDPQPPNLDGLINLAYMAGQGGGGGGNNGGMNFFIPPMAYGSNPFSYPTQFFAPRVNNEGGGDPGEGGGAVKPGPEGGAPSGGGDASLYPGNNSASVGEGGNVSVQFPPMNVPPSASDPGPNPSIIYPDGPNISISQPEIPLPGDTPPGITDPSPNYGTPGAPGSPGAPGPAGPAGPASPAGAGPSGNYPTSGAGGGMQSGSLLPESWSWPWINPGIPPGMMPYPGAGPGPGMRSEDNHPDSDPRNPYGGTGDEPPDEESGTDPITDAPIGSSPDETGPSLIDEASKGLAERVEAAGGEHVTTDEQAAIRNQLRGRDRQRYETFLERVNKGMSVEEAASLGRIPTDIARRSFPDQFNQ